MSTLVYGDDRLAMHIDTVQRTDRVTADRIVNEASRWGMSARRAAEIVMDILDRVPAAVDAARVETEALSADITAVIDSQVARLRGSLPDGSFLAS